MLGGILITFVYLYGPDGVGKTTHALLLIDKLRLEGYRVKRVGVRSNHYPFRAFWNSLKLVAGETYKYPDGYLTRIPRISVLRACSTLIICGQLFSISIFVLATFILSKLGYVIVAERYVLDTYTDFIYFVTKFTGKRIPRIVQMILLKLLPKDLIFIFLDADYSTLVKRYIRRNSVFEPEDYIQLQRRIGLIFTQRLFGFRIFTPLNSVRNTQNEVLKLVFSESHWH